MRMIGKTTATVESLTRNVLWDEKTVLIKAVAVWQFSLSQQCAGKRHSFWVVLLCKGTVTLPQPRIDQIDPFDGMNETVPPVLGQLDAPAY